MIDRAKILWFQQTGNIRGIIWVIFSSITFVAMSVAIKELSHVGFHPRQIIFMRFFTGIFIIMPFVFFQSGLRRGGFIHFLTDRPWTHLARGLFGICAANCGFLALTKLPLAEVNTLRFSMPLFIILWSVFFLGTGIHFRRTLATILGFAGVMVMLRPGFDTFNPYLLVALGDAFFASIALTFAKVLTKTDHPFLIIFYFYVIAIITMVIPAFYVWEDLTFYALGLAVLTGIFGTLGQVTGVYALRVGEMTVISPFGYISFLFSVLAGLWFFGELPHGLTYVGAAVIIISNLYILHRERLESREDKV
ncbi:MAG: DMT family transporter [Alphaproteobacteria bacterium]